MFFEEIMKLQEVEPDWQRWVTAGLRFEGYQLRLVTQVLATMSTNAKDKPLLATMHFLPLRVSPFKTVTVKTFCQVFCHEESVCSHLVLGLPTQRALTRKITDARITV